MRLINVAAAALNQTPLAWEHNKRNIIHAIETARAQQASVLCLPELCITGYGCEDMFHAPSVHLMAKQVLLEIAPHTQGLVVSLGLPVMHSGGLFNTACLVADGTILGFVGKQNLAGEGIHYEPRWFKRWPDDVRAETRIGDTYYPLGDLIFEVGGVLFGFEICEDAWVANRPGSDLARRGVDLILNPSASHFAFGKSSVRKRFVLEGSRAFHVSYVYSNLLGNESGRAIYDGGTMIASGGKLIAAGPRFSYADNVVTTAQVDIDMTRMVRARTGSFQPRIATDQSNCIRGEFFFPESQLQKRTLEISDWETSPTAKEEEFARAVSLALFDYLRKSRSRGFVVSLSGGADSAAVAVLCSLLVQFGVSDIGQQKFIEKLAYISQLAEAENEEAMVRQLLTTAYQATRNSGDVTRSAAAAVAQAIGALHYELDVDSLVTGYRSLISTAIGRELTWEADDITLQNIQARARAPGVWMLANLTGSLLLATSNRSEAAVGYATMDGDTCGGLSPIAGIDKAFLRQWLRWMETAGPQGLSPLPSLRAVNDQQPTAELRPQEQKQTDESDLMPYELLDEIERAAIRDKMSPAEVHQTICAGHGEYTPQQLLVWVERFFRLWCRNQWKRERYAPSFHVDDENLDPKTWCRFPILSGGFERELAELRAAVEGEG